MSRRLDDLSDRFRPLAMQLLARTVEAGIPVVIVDTLRTEAEHQANLAKGVSWTTHSKHCLTQDHAVLGSDLVWRPGGDLTEGDELLAFSEVANGKRRQYEQSKVLDIEPATADVYRVELSDGMIFHATREHKWLVDSGFGMHWVQTAQLRRGPELRSALVKAMDTFSPVLTYDVGWLAGFIDGEGSLAKDGSVSFAQRPGAVFDRAVGIARGLGYQVTIGSYGSGGLGKQDCLSCRINGDWGTRLGFLGRVRPMRLLSKVIDVRHTFQGTQRTLVMAVEKAPRRMDIVRMQTSSRTFISDGFAMHNCDGDAIDICPYAQYDAHGADKLLWDAGDPIWAKLAEIGRALGLRVGYDWKVKDCGHFEYVGEPAPHRSVAA